jgi:hypothetical protein
MGVSANSYGSPDEVAALTQRFTDPNTHLFTPTTRPTLAQVEEFIDRVSGILNVLLAGQGFSIPITQSDARLALAQFVVTECADLVNYANSAGRFFTEKNLGSSPWHAILKDAEEFISQNASGFEALGAIRVRSAVIGLKATTRNDAGDVIEPFFDRKQFGNRTTDWDVSL